MSCPYVTVQLTDGFGNQMFQVAAALGYAERYGCTPMFLKRPTAPKHHPQSTLNVVDFFPEIPILEGEEQGIIWKRLKEPAGAAFTYIPLPAPTQDDANILLEGYFQSERYFPSMFRMPNIAPAPVSLANLDFFAHDWPRTFFLHVRRGDYLHPTNRHHYIDLVGGGYYGRCLEAMKAVGGVCFVVSDDMTWCRQTLPSIAPPGLSLLWCPTDTTDAETFYWMTMCGAGAICANSTFSWWAAYFIHRSHGPSARLFMPKPWGHPPMPPVRDLYPSWVDALECRKN